MSWDKQKGGNDQPIPEVIKDHAQLTNLEYENSKHTGFQKQVSTWATGKAYKVNDLVVDNGALYRCIVDHQSTALSADSTKWECLTSNSSGGPSTVKRISKPNVTAPLTVDLPGKLELIQPRIFKEGTETTELVCDFNNSDASDFIIDGQPANQSKYYVWDGTMRPQISYGVNVSPVTMGEGKYFATDFIDFAEYQKIESINI